MTLMLERFGRPRIAFNAEGGGSGGGEGGNEGGSTAPEMILFGGDNADDKAGAGDDKAGDDKAGAADWKEYENDPSKTDEENAAAKAEHDKTKPAGDDKSKDDPANQVPEDGKYELTMPDGIELDAELLGAVSPRFKELGLTRAQAQALTDDFIKVQQERATKQTQEWGERIAGWADEAKKDKEIGGDKWNTTVTNATRFTNTFGTPALKDYLNASGGGNHPELIRAFAKAGELIREDSPPTGGAGGAAKPAEAAHILFKDDVPKG